MTDMNQTPHRLQILRYDFLPPLHPDSPGHGGIQLVLPAHAQTGDLDTLVLPIADWQGRTHLFRFHADTKPDGALRVAPGHISLSSHRDLEAAFYTFGGVMTIESQPDEQIVTITSDAPVLELSLQAETSATMLAAEVEAMLARLEATQKRPHLEVIDGLSAAGGLTFYLAFLRSMISWYQDKAAWRHLYPKLVALLEHERDWYVRSGQWSNSQPDLAQLIERIPSSS